MNGAHVLFKPERVACTKPTHEIAARLAQLRQEAMQRAIELRRAAPDLFRAPDRA